MTNQKDHYNSLYLKRNIFGYKEWLYAPYIKALLRVAGLKGGSTILDVGCGQGFFSYLFSRYGMKVFGMDISETGINIAKSTYSSYGIEFILADVEAFPFVTGKFDCVFTRSCSMYNTDNFPVRREITKNLLKYIKREGTFIFLYNTNFNNSKKSERWRYHTLNDMKEHFSQYEGARFYFINKVDTLLMGKHAFSGFFMRINIMASKFVGIGGDLVCIIKQNK